MAELSLAELGEFGLIGALRRRARAGARREWVRGIGDDAAVLRPRAGRDLVVTADALIEDVHFRWSTTSARELGHKALAVNLSDLAAMGAEPLGFVLTWGFPPDTPGARLDGVLAGLLALARAARCPLVGGDTVRAPCWQLSLTLFGEVPRGRALLRSGARPGDRLVVTGALGGAALGLALLEGGRGAERGVAPFVRRQLRPQARLAAGQALLRRGWAHATLDVSDGLLRDAGHIAEESGVGLELWAAALPLERGLAPAARRLGLDPLALAAGGGEDYELLVALAPAAPGAAALRRALCCPVTEIGRVRRGRGVRLLARAPSPEAGEGVELPAFAPGFEHFKRCARESDK